MLRGKIYHWAWKFGRPKCLSQFQGKVSFKTEKNDVNLNLICRWKKGVASTLSYFEITDEKSPILKPYPSWEDHELPEEGKPLERNSTIISTFRVRADECDRLWVN